MFGKNKNKDKKESMFDSKDFNNSTSNNNSLDQSLPNNNFGVSSDLNNSHTNSQNGPVDKNEVFFEKFEKSKKDFIKEKRKEKNRAKKSISNQNKLLGFENRLRDDSYFKKFWIILLSITALLLTYACIVMGFLGPHFSKVSDGSRWTPAVNVYGGLTRTSIIFSGVIIALIPLPYIFLLTSWFIGINSVHRSKVFIISNIVIVSFSAVLVVLTIPLSSFVFNRVLSFLPVTS